MPVHASARPSRSGDVPSRPQETKAALEALLAGTPQKHLIQPLLNNLKNADGFPVDAFNALVVRSKDASPENRQKLHQAVIDRERNGGFDPPLHRPLADALLRGVPWSAVRGAATACFGPQAALATLLAQLATAALPHLRQGRLPSALAAMQLVPWHALVPSLRNIDQIDQLVNALPATLQDMMAALHEALTGLDEECTPHSLPACAALGVAVGLWALYGAAGDVHGAHAQRLLKLPRWLTVALQGNRQLGAVFAPPDPSTVTRRAIEARFDAFTAIRQTLDEATAAGAADEATVSGLIEKAAATHGETTPAARAYADVQRVLQRQLPGPDAAPSVCQTLLADIDGHLSDLSRLLQPGEGEAGVPASADPAACDLLFEGECADAVEDPPRSAPSASGIASTLWQSCATQVANALQAIGNLAGSGSAKADGSAAEPRADAAASNAGDTQATASVALLAPAVAVAVQHRGPVPRGPLMAAAGTGLALGAATIATARYLLGRAAQTGASGHEGGGILADTLQDLEHAEGTIVPMPDGSWASQWDVEHPAPAGGAMHPRSRRNAPVPDAAPVPTDADTEAATVRSRHVMEEALLGQLSQRPAFAWLKAMQPAEQRLWLTQHIALERLDAEREQSYPAAPAQLDAALRSAGWTGRWDDIEVEVPGCRIDDRAYRDRLPLLEYCLYRPHDAALRLFSRNGMPLSDAEDQMLTAWITSPGCTGLADAMLRAPAVDAVLVDTMKARFKRAALESKGRGLLTGGESSYLRGADIVLGFINGDAHIEHGELEYTGLAAKGLGLPAGVLPASFRVPGYLILRSGESDPDSHRRGQVVVYRASDRSLIAFPDDQAFHSFISAKRAGQDLAVRDAIRADIVAAAPPAARDVLRVLQSEAPYAGRPVAWGRQDHLLFRFNTLPPAIGPFEQWAQDAATRSTQHAAAVAAGIYAEQAAQWTPIARQAAAATQAVAAAQSAVTPWEDLARPLAADVLNAFHERSTGEAHLLEATDRVELRFGGRQKDLAWWVTQGWKQHGPQERIGREFPGQAVMRDMQLIVYSRTASGGRTPDASRTALLNQPVYKKQLCYGMRDLVSDQQSLKAYQSYLSGIEKQPAGQRLEQAMADSLRWRTRALIERSTGPGGNLAPAARSALLAAHAGLDSAEPSLSVVTLGGVTVEGLWALRAGDDAYVVVLSGPHGDQLLDTAQFQALLANDYARVEPFLQTRAGFDQHADLAKVLTRRRVSNGVPVGLEGRYTPQAAARLWLTKLEKNAVERSQQGDMTFEDWFKLCAGLGTMGICVVATGGVGTALCTAASAAWVVQGFREGAESLERGELLRALGEMVGAGAAGFGLLAPARVARMLFHTNRRAVGTAAEVTEALLDVAAQAVNFDPSGLLMAGAAGLPAVGPALIRRAKGGGTEVLQQGRTFVETSRGDFAETAIDTHGIRRLVDQTGGSGAGAPVIHTEGAWRRQDEAPDQWLRRTTTVQDPVPGAIAGVPAFASLDANAKTRLSALYGLKGLRLTPSPDLARRVDVAVIDSRVTQMISDPQSIGLPTDMPAVLRTWCRSPRLGQQRGLQLYTSATRHHDGTAGPVFGYPDIGLSIAVRAGQLPTLEQVVDAAGFSKVATRLGMAAASSRESVMHEVKRELGAQLFLDKNTVAQGWQRWLDRYGEAVTPLSDTVHQQYPGLTRQEAHYLSRQPGVAEAARQSRFTEKVDRSVSELLATRNEREIRDDLLDGKVTSLNHMNALQAQLNRLLPTMSWTVTGQMGMDKVLRFEQGGRIQECMRLDANDVLRAADSSAVCSTWQACIQPQLPAATRADIPTADALRRQIQDKMAVTPVGPSCIVRSMRGSHRSRRAVDDPTCPAPVKQPAVDPALISASEDVLKQHKTMTTKIWKEVLTGPPGLQQPLSRANFATWRIEGLEVSGNPIRLSEDIASGTTVSGAFVLPDMLTGTSPANLLIAAPEGVPEPGLLRGVLSERYALGADAVGMDKGLQNAYVTLTQDDLDKKMGKAKKKLTEMENDELAKLQHAQLPAALKAICGQGKPVLLKENLADLKPGRYRVYKVRSCAEGKFLDGFLSALTAHSSSAKEVLGKDGYSRIMSGAIAPDPAVRGRIALFTDMDPCVTSCDRRLRGLSRLFPNLQIRVQSAFLDNDARRKKQTEWEQNYMDSMRAGWEKERKTNAQMKSLTTQKWYEAQYPPMPRTWNAAESPNVVIA